MPEATDPPPSAPSNEEVLDAWTRAAQAFDAWDHAALRQLIETFDPPAVPEADATGPADAAGSPSRLYGRLLRAQLAVREDQPEAALSCLESAEDLHAPTFGQTPQTTVTQDAALATLASGERAVARAYVLINVMQGHDLDSCVELAWAAAGQSPPGYLGNRQRARTAFLWGMSCSLADETAEGDRWFALAYELAQAADLRELAAQALLARVGTALRGPDDAGGYCGPADPETLARVGDAEMMLARAEEWIDDAPDYLRHTFALKRLFIDAERGLWEQMIAASDTMLAEVRSTDQRRLIVYARARALARVEQIEAALATVDDEMLQSRACGQRDFEEMFCEVGAGVAFCARRHDDEIRYLGRLRQLRTDQRREEAVRQARMGALRLTLERARRDAAEERSRAFSLRLEAAALEHNAGALAEAAITDPLTGLENRLGFEPRMTEAHAKALDAGRPLCLALLDIDHFKRVNDSFGHLTGDAVLRRLGQLLRLGIRPGDLAARLGGEEFAILFARAGLPQSLAACERLRESVQRQEWADLVPGATVTVSLGLVDAGTHPTPEAAYAEADRLLYEAKHDGRNCVRAQSFTGASE